MIFFVIMLAALCGYLLGIYHGFESTERAMERSIKRTGLIDLNGRIYECRNWQKPANRTRENPANRTPPPPPRKK